MLRVKCELAVGRRAGGLSYPHRWLSADIGRTPPGHEIRGLIPGRDSPPAKEVGSGAFPGTASGGASGSDALADLIEVMPPSARFSSRDGRDPPIGAIHC